MSGYKHYAELVPPDPPPTTAALKGLAPCARGRSTVKAIKDHRANQRARSSPCSGSEKVASGYRLRNGDGPGTPADRALRQLERQWHELRRHVPGRLTNVSNLRGRQVRAQRQERGHLRERVGGGRARTGGRYRVRQTR